MKQITSLSAVDSKAMDFHSATGKLQYTLTNDFLFKALLQKNRKVLKALVASLMHLWILICRIFLWNFTAHINY